MVMDGESLVVAPLMAGARGKEELVVIRPIQEEVVIPVTGVEVKAEESTMPVSMDSPSMSFTPDATPAATPPSSSTNTPPIVPAGK